MQVPDDMPAVQLTLDRVALQLGYPGGGPQLLAVHIRVRSCSLSTNVDGVRLIVVSQAGMHPMESALFAPLRPRHPLHP